MFPDPYDRVNSLPEGSIPGGQRLRLREQLKIIRRKIEETPVHLDRDTVSMGSTGNSGNGGITGNGGNSGSTGNSGSSNAGNANAVAVLPQGGVSQAQKRAEARGGSLGDKGGQVSRNLF